MDLASRTIETASISVIGATDAIEGAASGRTHCLHEAHAPEDPVGAPEKDGARKFSDSFDGLLDGIGSKGRQPARQ